MYYTLQGEGAHTGRPAVFCRFTGCNLWSGREEDRHKAVCQFCDTDFIGIDGENGGKYKADELAQKVAQFWEGKAGKPYVVCTGGEPLLQLDEPLIEAFHQHGLEVAIETNGTIKVPESIDWVCVSPKAYSKVIVTKGDELKLVYPQATALPDRFATFDFTHFYLQPMDGDNQAENIQQTVQYCLEHPQWNLSLQTHKFIDIP